MTSTQTRYEFQAFCYKHHIEMKPNQTLPATGNGRPQGITFACPKPDCMIRYNSSKGYFALTQDARGNWGKPELGPLVTCERDGAPMYLSEFFPDRWSLRLWKCPLCKTVRANGEISSGVRASRSNGQ